MSNDEVDPGMPSLDSQFVALVWILREQGITIDTDDLHKRAHEMDRALQEGWRKYQSGEYRRELRPLRSVPDVEEDSDDDR
jgi:hypothetical protein